MLKNWLGIEFAHTISNKSIISELIMNERDSINSIGMSKSARITQGSSNKRFN